MPVATVVLPTPECVPATTNRALRERMAEDHRARAGGEPLLGAPGAYSYRLTWEEIAAQEPEVVVFMPCGYHLEAACAQAVHLLERPELAGAERFLAADSGGYFSRPGPRLVDGVEALAASFHGPGELPAIVARLR